MKKLVLKLKVKSIFNTSLDARLESNDRIDSALNYIKGKTFDVSSEDIILIDNCKLSYSHIDFTIDKEGNRYIEIISDSLTDTLYYYIIDKYRTNSTITASCSNCKHLIIECHVDNYNATHIGDRKNKGQSYKYKITLYMNTTIDSTKLYSLLCRKHLDYIIDYEFRGTTFTQLTLLSGNVEKPEVLEDHKLSFIAIYNQKLDNYAGDADIYVYNDCFESSPIGGYKNIQMTCNMIEENSKESPITEIANISVKLKYNFHKMKMNGEVIRDPYAAMDLINKITNKKFIIAGYTAILKNIDMDINNYDKILTISIDCRMSCLNAEKFYSYFRYFPCKLLEYPKVLLKFLDNINFVVECSLNPTSIVMSVEQEEVEKKEKETESILYKNKLYLELAYRCHKNAGEDILSQYNTFSDAFELIDNKTNCLIINSTIVNILSITNNMNDAYNNPFVYECIYKIECYSDCDAAGVELYRNIQKAIAEHSDSGVEIQTDNKCIYCKPISIESTMYPLVIKKKVEEKKPMEENKEYIITIKANEVSSNDKINHILKNSIDFIIGKSGKNLLDIKSDMISNYNIEDGRFNILISIPHSFTSMILGEGMKAQSVNIVAYNGDAPMFVIENLTCVIEEINRKADLSTVRNKCIECAAKELEKDVSDEILGNIIKKEEGKPMEAKKYKYKYHLWFEPISRPEISFLDTMIDKKVSLYFVDVTNDNYFSIFSGNTIAKLYKIDNTEDDVYYTSFYSDVDIEPKFKTLSTIRYRLDGMISTYEEMKFRTTIGREQMIDDNKVKIADYKPIVAYKLTLRSIAKYATELLNDAVAHGTSFSIHRKDVNIIINCNKDRILKPMYKNLNYDYELFIKADVILSDGSDNLKDMECEITLYNDDNAIGYIKHILIDAEPIYGYGDITPFVTVIKSEDHLSPDIHYDGKELYTFASDGSKIVLSPDIHYDGKELYTFGSYGSKIALSGVYPINNISTTIDNNTKKEEDKPMETITTNTFTVELKGVNKNHTMSDIEAIKFVSGLRIDKTIIKAIYNQVKSIIFHDPETKIIWKDGSVTKVSCGKEKYDKEYGVVFCVLKKLLGNTSNYYDLIKDLVKLGDKQIEERVKAKADKEAKRLAAKRKKQKEEAKNHRSEDSEYDTTSSTVPEDLESNNEDNN